MARWFLFATSIVFVGFGLWGLISPAATVSNFGIALDGPDATTMVRASYGGFLIGEGMLFAWCAVSLERIRIGLFAVVLLTAPILLSRLIGMVVDGSTSNYHRTYVGIELLGIGLATWFLMRGVKP